MMRFSIRLNDTVLHTSSDWVLQFRTRYISDVRNWKDRDSYQEAFVWLRWEFGGEGPDQSMSRTLRFLSLGSP